MPTMLHELAATAILRRDGTFRPVRAHEISSRLRPCNLVGTDLNLLFYASSEGRFLANSIIVQNLKRSQASDSTVCRRGGQLPNPGSAALAF